MRTINLALVDSSSDQSTLGNPPPIRQQVIQQQSCHDIESGISKSSSFFKRIKYSLRLITRPPQFTFSFGFILSLSGQISSLIIIILTIIYACKIHNILPHIANPSNDHWTLHIFLVGASCLISFEGISFISSALSLWLPTRIVFVIFGLSTVLSIISGALLFGWIIYSSTADVSVVTPMTILPSHISSLCSGPAILITVFVFWLVCGLLNVSYLHLVLFPLLRSYTTLSPIPLFSQTKNQHDLKECGQRNWHQYHIRGGDSQSNNNQSTSTATTETGAAAGFHISPSQWRRSPLAPVSHNQQNSLTSQSRLTKVIIAPPTQQGNHHRFIPKLNTKASIASLKDKSRSLATFIAHPTSSIETLRSMNAAQNQLDQKMHQSPPQQTSTSPSKFNKMLISKHLQGNNNNNNKENNNCTETPPASRMMLADNFCLEDTIPQTVTPLDRIKGDKSAKRQRLSSLRFSKDLFISNNNQQRTNNENGSQSTSSNSSPFENWDASSFGVRERVLWTMAQLSSSSSLDTQQHGDIAIDSATSGDIITSTYNQEEQLYNDNGVASLAIAQPETYNTPSGHVGLSTDIYQESPLQDKLARNLSQNSVCYDGSEHGTMSSLSSARSFSSYQNLSNQRSRSPVKATLSPRKRQDSSRFSSSCHETPAIKHKSPPKQWSPGSMISLHLTPDNSDKDDSPNTLASSDSANIILRDLCDMVAASDSIKPCSPVRQAESPSIQAASSSIWTSTAVKEDRAGSSAIYYNSRTPDRRGIGVDNVGQSPTKDMSTLRTRRGGASYAFSTINNNNNNNNYNNNNDDNTPSATSSVVGGGSPIKSGRSESVDVVKTLFFSSQYDRERWHNSRSIRKTSRILSGPDQAAVVDGISNKDL